MRTADPRLAAGSTAVAVLLAFAAACGGSPEPQPLPKPSSSTSPSPSASASAEPTPPVMPEAAGAKTKAGAEAFVRHYVDVLNYATFTGDTETAQALDGGKCTSCDRMLKSIKHVYDSGGRVEGGAWTPTPVGQAPFPDGSGRTLDVKITYGPQSVFADAKSEAKRYTGGGRLVSFVLEIKAGGGWQIAEWTRAS